MLKLQVVLNVNRMRVTFFGFILGVCLLLFIHQTPWLAGEIGSQIDEIQSDTEEMKSASEKALGEDSRDCYMNSLGRTGMQGVISTTLKSSPSLHNISRSGTPSRSCIASTDNS